MISFILCLLAILAVIVTVGAFWGGFLFLLFKFFNEKVAGYILIAICVVLFLFIGWDICGDFGCRP